MSEVSSVKWTVRGAFPDVTSAWKSMPPVDVPGMEDPSKMKSNIDTVNAVVIMDLNSFFSDMINHPSNELPLSAYTHCKL